MGADVGHDEFIARDKTNLDLLWLKDDSLEDVDAIRTKKPSVLQN
ncbi:MAG: hypothetical protein ABJN22_12495 [Litorimonas sp.]